MNKLNLRVKNVISNETEQYKQYSFRYTVKICYNDIATHIES